MPLSYSDSRTPNRVYLNRIETVVPDHECHARFLSFLPKLVEDAHSLKLMQRLASKAQIDRRYSVLEISDDENCIDTSGLYKSGKFASTGQRMELYKKHALPLATKAVRPLIKGKENEITHLIVASCTGFYAPGLDLELQQKFGLRSDLERSIIGFMGCYAAFNAMKSAYHIVRSEPAAKVLVVNLELCSLHLQETADLEKLLGFMQFADGCAASLISAKPEGFELKRFKTEVVSEDREMIQWHIGDQGFEMHLSTDVPHALCEALPNVLPKLFSGEERAQMKLWAIHPGGRAVLDSVQTRLELRDDEIAPSREVLRNFGNMSSATVMFVLQSLMKSGARGLGAAMAFGPGLTVESMVFEASEK